MDYGQLKGLLVTGHLLEQIFHRTKPHLPPHVLQFIGQDCCSRFETFYLAKHTGDDHIGREAKEADGLHSHMLWLAFFFFKCMFFMFHHCCSGSWFLTMILQFPSKCWDGFSIQFAGEAIPGRKLYWQPQHGLADIKVAGGEIPTKNGCFFFHGKIIGNQRKTIGNDGKSPVNGDWKLAKLTKWWIFQVMFDRRLQDPMGPIRFLGTFPATRPRCPRPSMNSTWQLTRCASWCSSTSTSPWLTRSGLMRFDGVWCSLRRLRQRIYR